MRPWHGEKIAGPRKLSFEGLMAACPEVRYAPEVGASGGGRCQYYDGFSGASITAWGDCARTARSTDSPLVDAASTILEQLRQRLSAHVTYQDPSR